MLPLLVLSALLGACMDTNPETSEQRAFEVSGHELYYVKSDAGRVLHFGMDVVNQTDSTQRFFAFAYATKEAADPPARAVYPPRALSGMPPNRKFGVADPSIGLDYTLGPGQATSFEGALPVPETWYDGRAIDVLAFDRLYIYFFSPGGRRIFFKSWPIDR